VDAHAGSMSPVRTGLGVDGRRRRACSRPPQALLEAATHAEGVAMRIVG